MIEHRRPDGAAPRASRAAALRERAREAVRFHPREAIALAVLALLLIVGASIAYARGRPVAAPPLAPVAAPSAAASPSAARIWVDVVGAVRRPGVYPFDQGARVFDAVRAAGGFARGADVQAVNLARPLVDGEQIVVPRAGQTVGPAPGGGGAPPAQSGGKVNINIASESDLENLPGIGPVLAQRIVDYRTQHGAFRTVQDLLKVPGIGQRKFDSLQPYVTV